MFYEIVLHAKIKVVIMVLSNKGNLENSSIQNPNYTKEFCTTVTSKVFLFSLQPLALLSFEASSEYEEKTHKNH